MADIRGIVSAEETNADELVDEIADAVCERVKQKSPKKTGKYSRGWNKIVTIKYGSKYRVVTNTTKPELTHVFENGTGPRKTKAGRSRGAVSARPHIRLAFDEIVQEYEAKISN